jgi:hypothetical protein
MAATRAISTANLQIQHRYVSGGDMLSTTKPLMHFWNFWNAVPGADQTQEVAFGYKGVLETGFRSRISEYRTERGSEFCAVHTGRKSSNSKKE